MIQASAANLTGALKKQQILLKYNSETCSELWNTTCCVVQLKCCIMEWDRQTSCTHAGEKEGHILYVF
jgi:hypothetical protein